MTISHHDFNRIASSGVRPKKKRQAPFSLRLNFEEKAALKKMAGNEPLGAYIKAVLFDEARTGVRRSNSPKHDGKAVGRALGELGKSRLSQNLNQLAKAVNMGALPVGTHALKAGSRTTLWKRLSQHKGVARSGGGNHRGSIFRLIVGTALLDRDELQSESWDNRQSTAPREIRLAEQPIEQVVSGVIGAMPFLWLDVGDDAGAESERGIIERGSIALLSNWRNEPIDPPSDSWLGNYCNRERVRKSGLWNSNHVDEAHDPRFFDVLERRVKQMGTRK